MLTTDGEATIFLHVVSKSEIQTQDDMGWAYKIVDHVSKQFQ